MKTIVGTWIHLCLAVLLMAKLAAAQQIDYNQQIKNKPAINTTAPLSGGSTLNPSATIKLTQCPAFQTYRMNSGGVAWECSLVDWVQQLSNKPVRDVRNYGNSLTGTGKQAYSGSLSAGSTTFTLGNTLFDTFAPSDVGRSILISGGCGVNVCDTWSSIAGYVSPTQITLSTPAANTLTFVSEVYWWNPQQDDTAFIQAAINDTTVTAPTVYLPRGVYVIDNTNAPLSYSPMMRAMIGDGRQSTVIIPQNNQFQSRTIVFNDVNHFLLKGITFRGPGINGIFGGNVTFHLVNGSNTENLRIEDVEVRHACSDAIFVDTCILCSFRNVKTVLNAAPGVHLKNPVSVSLQQVYSITNVLSGIWIDGGADVDISGSASESNGISYYINNAFDVSVRDSDAEAQVHRAPSAPASFPSISLAAGGSIPVGTYFLKYTWVRQWSGNSVALESTSSPESSQVTVTSGNQTINFTLPAAPTDAPLVSIANIYLTPTSGASGTEGFEKAVSVSASPTAVSLGSFTTPGPAPPAVSQIGHAFVVDGGAHIHIDTDNSNGVPTTDARHLLITDAADDVQVDNFRVIEGSTTPAFDMQVSPGVTNTRLAGNFSGIALSDSGTKTVLLDRGTFKAPVFNALTGFQQNSAAPSGHTLIGNGANYVDGVLSANQITAAGSTGQIQFNGNTALGADAKLFWDNTNKFLGVGPAAPDVTFVVSSSASAGAMQLSINNQAAGGSEWYLGSTDNGNASGGGLFLINNSNGTNSPAFAINSSKQVAIGTKTPSALFQVNSSVSGGANQIELSNAATGGANWWLGSSDNGNGIGGGKFVIHNANSTAGSQFTIDSATNNVGIGQTSPAFALDTTGVVNATAGFKSGTSTFSGLAACGGSTEGRMAAITDSTTNIWGATITGGGSNHVLAYCDGTNWTVAAK